MQYKPEAEKVAMIGGPYTSGVQSVPLAEDPQVQRTRKTFMIIVGICLVLCVVSFFVTVFGSGTQDASVDARQGYKIAQPLLSVLFYGFGIFVAYRYSTIGLRVFAWIGIVLLVIMGIGILIILGVAVIALVSVSGFDTEARGIVIAASVIAFIFVAVYTVAFILSVIIVNFAFKLARLIDANKNVVTQII